MASPISIGIVADLRTYQSYFSRFCVRHPDCHLIEIHILERDLDEDFPTKMAEVEAFIRDQKINHLSFHAPDLLMQSVLFEEESPHLEDDKRKFSLFFDTIRRLSDNLCMDVIVVVHQGIKLPNASFAHMTPAQFDAWREQKLKKAQESYRALRASLSGSKVIAALENSPPFAGDSDRQHIMDLAFEDFAARMDDGVANANAKSDRPSFVFDCSHAALCVEYFKHHDGSRSEDARKSEPHAQDKMNSFGLESVRRKYHGIPPSLRSVEDYVRCAGKHVCWMHISDANGFLPDNEGKVIGVAGSVIDFKKLFRAICAHVQDPKGVLELVNAHKDYGLLETSMTNIQKYL